MNPSTLIGIVASVVLLVVVVFFAAGDPAQFVDWTGLAIVVAGTLAATFLSYPLREVVRGFGLIGTVLRNEKLYAHDDIDELVRLSRLWLKGNVAEVEKALPHISNPFLRTGVQLVIDRVSEEEIMDLMHWRIEYLRARESAEAQLFRGMANYAPAFGMLGTLIGLINLMDLLGAGDMRLIGQQLAVALMTTFYGILLANLLFKPIAVKLERRTEERIVVMNMVLQGISMMRAQRSPSMMREALKTFVAHHEDEVHDSRTPPRKPADDAPPREAV